MTSRRILVDAGSRSIRMSAAEIVTALGGHWRGSYGRARCPAHKDRNPSLSIREGADGKLLVKCPPAVNSARSSPPFRILVSGHDSGRHRGH
jgi:hypothetical protein